MEKYLKHFIGHEFTVPEIIYLLTVVALIGMLLFSFLIFINSFLALINPSKERRSILPLAVFMKNSSLVISIVSGVLWYFYNDSFLPCIGGVAVYLLARFSIFLEKILWKRQERSF